MQQLVDDLKAIPGVIGACVYHGTNGLEANNLPSLFKTERLNQIGKLLNKAVAAGRLNFPGLNDLMFCYEEAAIVCRPLEEGRNLAVVCDPGINMNLLAMSMNLAMTEQQSPAQPSAPAPAAAEPVPAAAAAPPAPVDTSALMENGALATPLQVMQKQLTKVMGPMAQIVFEDALGDWAGSGPTDRSNLGRLVELLGQEIGDPDKIQTYRDLVRAALAQEG